MANNHRTGWRSTPVTAGISWLMKLLMLGIAPLEVMKGEVLFAVLTVLAFAISLIPSVIERNHRVTLPFELDLLITANLFFHTFVGEGLEVYTTFTPFDKLLHLYGGAVIGMIAFLFIYTLHYTKKLRLTVPLVGFFTVAVALAAGGIWEIIEFAVDTLFAKHTQSGLDDTMYDMISDLAGAVVVAVFGMVYVKYSRPETRRRLTRPLGELFGIGGRIDRIKARLAAKNGGGNLMRGQ